MNIFRNFKIKVVAYNDRNPLKIATIARLQKQREEVIESLSDMIEEALNKLKISNCLQNLLRIVVYRNGLSNGVYEKVSTFLIKK